MFDCREDEYSDWERELKRFGVARAEANELAEEFWADIENGEATLDLAPARDLQEVLDWLLAQLKTGLIKNVRFYYLDDSSSPPLLVSGGCSGHEPALARTFSCGNITHEFERESESTICFRRGQAVVLRAFQTLSSPVEHPGIGTIPHLDVPDPCRGKFENSRLNTHDSRPRLYVDFPVEVGGKWLGKFSCDFETTDSERIDEGSVIRCAAFAHEAATMLYCLMHQKQEEAIHRAISHYDETQGPAGFGEVLRSELKLNARDAVTYFPVVCDTESENGNMMRVLPLAFSTSETYRAYVRTGKCYLLKGSALVPTVATAGRTLRLTQLHDTASRVTCCKRYGVEKIAWDDDYIFGDWSEIDAVLALPVLDPRQNRVLGVFVVTRHYQSDGFTYEQERDGRLLIRSVFVGSEATSEFARISFNPSRYAKFSVECSRLCTSVDPFDEATKLLADVCPERDGQKLFAVCCLDGSSPSKLRVLSAHGKLKEHSRTRDYAPDTSITKAAIETQPRDVIYRNIPSRNLRDVVRQRFPYTAHAVCEIGCAFEGCSGASVGAVLVKSSVFDLDCARVGPYLRILSEWLTQRIVRAGLISAEQICDHFGHARVR